MKTSFTFLGTLFLFGFLLWSCENESPMEKDAQKAADIMCDFQPIQEKLLSGDEEIMEEATQEADEIQAKADEMQKGFEEKYSEEEIKDLQDLIDEKFNESCDFE